MKIRILSILMFLALGLQTAWSYTVDNLPMVPLEYTDSTDFSMVCNPDGILSQAQVDSLNAMLWNIRQTKGVQGLAVCVKEIEPDEPFEFGIGVFNKYGVGGKTQNAGFLVLLATETRAYYINTGEGMEKYLTDAQCGSIERHYMVPRFKDGDWATGLIDGVKMICEVCSGEAELNPEDENGDEEDGDLGTALLVIFGPMAACGGVAMYQDYRKKKCPKCGKHTMKHTKREIVKVTRNTSSGVVPLKCHLVDHYVCQACGYHKIVESDGAYNDYKQGTFYGGLDNWGAVATASSIVSGGYGRGRDSGSWGGGGGFSSFGGGFSGGGGAGGHF